MHADAGAGDILLVADDFGLSEGVTSGISKLATARRISGTSALVTLPRWRQDGARLAQLRGDVAIGLHFNLTLGAPLGTMASLAPSGQLPDIGTLVRSAVLGRIDRGEVAAEAERQLRRFEDGCGFKADFIDGHQHAHALAGVREGLITAIGNVYRDAPSKPLVRVPADRALALLQRPGARGKALMLAMLASGFSKSLAAAGLPFNTSFAGVTGFADKEAGVRHDLDAAANAARGGLHLVMCHPGVPDAELAALDPITTRRAVELDILASDNVLTARLYHPVRGADGTIDWRLAGAAVR